MTDCMYFLRNCCLDTNNMLRIIIFTSLLCSLLVDGSPRIVNGKDAEEGEFPFAVSIRDKNNKHFCGGTILNENHVLTAAHCLCDEISSEPPYSIQYGSVHISNEDTRSVPVSNFSCNSQYDNVTFDVAVIRLESAIPEGNWSAVELAKEFSPTLFTKGTIIGWGMLWDGGPVSQVLQKLDVNVLLDVLCGMKFNTHHQICVSSLFSGACNGDSGSALLVNGIQVGLASFVTTNCEATSAISPNIYARIPEYYAWIQTLMNI